MDNYRVVWHTHGFEWQDVFSEREWGKITDEFVELYNDYCKATNPLMDRINDTWNKFDSMRECSTETAALMAGVMGIEPDAAYEDWVEKWCKEACDAVNKVHPFAKLKGFIFRDGELPIFGVQFKKHPDWTMDFTLKKVE